MEAVYTEHGEENGLVCWQTKVNLYNKWNRRVRLENIT